MDPELALLRESTLLGFMPRELLLLLSDYKLHCTYYKTGEFKCVYQRKNGKLHGSFIEQYPNGKVKFQASFDCGVLHGRLISYHPNSKLWQDIDFVNGLPMISVTIKTSGERIETQLLGVSYQAKPERDKSLKDYLYSAWWIDEEKREQVYIDWIQEIDL
jgi:antitoxin component YwqK of YwqJK toxin-antitoxin module